MALVVETTLRGPQAYGLARRVLDEMEAADVWPTPLNYELWIHYLGEPDGALGQEIRRILAAQEPFTEAVSDMLAAEYLPRGRLSDEIRDAGRVLDRELTSVATAIAEAHKSQTEYGEVLAEASADIQQAAAPDTLHNVVVGLTSATRKVQEQNADLEIRLDASTREVARLRDHLEQVRRDAMTDALTNLANRKAFDEQLEACVELAQREGRELFLAIVDIDHFKRFNDNWGHQTGDQVLRYVASVLGRMARAPRMAARYGGEEFAVIFPGESEDHVASALDSVRAEIGSRTLRRRSTEDELGAVTISAGYARMVRGETATALLGRADAALYASKHDGRNRVTSAERMQRAAA